MAVVVVVRCIAVLVCLVQLTAGSSLAKTSCLPSCGGVEIPYPFGIGKSCSLDEWFEIVCKNESRPFLKKPNLEVLEIGLDNSTILVRHPIIMSGGCQGARGLGIVANLTGSNLFFAPGLNTFSGVGCNYRFEMENTESFVIGCRTSCGRGADADVTSCRVGFPSVQIKVFNVSFERTVRGAGSGSCGHAFVADDAWLKSYSNFSMQDLGFYVPASLLWLVSNDSVVPVLHGEEGFSCGPYDSDNPSLMSCHCSSGFKGNPYLPDGCKDTTSIMSVCVKYRERSICIASSMTKLLIISFVFDIVLLFCAIVTLLVFARWLYKVVKKRNKIKHLTHLLEQELKANELGHVETTRVFTSKELQVATDHFNPDRVLGHGGQGTVYKGMLSDGRIVAVKKSKIQNEPMFIKEFINEVVLLSRINHRNIVKLLGCCLETQNPLLVFEFVPNGTLSSFIHEQDEMIVSWQMRLQIASDIAGALSYLHSASSVPIYHRDIKSTNILLDLKYRAKLSDFGTSRSVAVDQTHLSTLVQGTFGYFDPEYFISSQFTDKSDVYSFGVVLVELLTGQKPICPTRPEEHRSLVAYFMTSLEENRLFDIVDASVVYEKKDAVLALADLARRCLNSHGRDRPTMKQVSMELEIITAMSEKGQQSNLEAMFAMDHEEANGRRSRNEVGTFEIDRVPTSDDQPLLPRCQSF